MVSSAVGLSESKLLCPNGYPNGNPNFSNQKLESRSRLPDTFTMWTSHVRVRCSLLGDSPANSPAFARRIRKSFAFECTRKMKSSVPCARLRRRRRSERLGRLPITSRVAGESPWVIRRVGAGEMLKKCGSPGTLGSKCLSASSVPYNRTKRCTHSRHLLERQYATSVDSTWTTNGTAGGESGEELGKQQQQSHTGNLLLTILNSQLRTLSLSFSNWLSYLQIPHYGNSKWFASAEILL